MTVVGAGWQPGDVIVFRGANHGKIWFALPVFVVQDTPALLAVYWPAGTPNKLRRKPSGERYTPRDVLREPLDLADSAWVRTDVLMLIPAGAAHAVYVMWEAGQKRFLGWYCNLQYPIRRTHSGFETDDLWIDIVFAPDGSGWHWKDEAELEEAVAEGLLSTAKAAAIRQEGERVIRQYEENRPPFRDGWEHWKAPAGWGIPALREDWDEGYR